MIIFVLNNGSSSIKCSLFDFANKNEAKWLWKAHIQWKKDLTTASLKIKNYQEESLPKILKFK
jgi:acetate kinase